MKNTVLIACAVIFVAGSAHAEDVYFPDPELETAVRDALGIEEPTPITPADMLNLTSLSARYGYISDLTGLEYAANLTNLNLYRNQISDISALSGLTNLTDLDLHDNQISDISALSGLTNLTDLELHCNPIGDMSPISMLTRLTTLRITPLKPDDVADISGAVNLTTLFLYENRVSDLSALSGLPKLQSLHVSYNKASQLYISGLANLTSLWVWNAGTTDVDISDLASVTELHLGRSYIRKISISNMPNLTDLNLGHNLISDISSLSGLPNLTDLDLGYNRISDISALSALTCLTNLDLTQNQISDISALSALTNLTDLDLYDNQITDVSALSALTNLTDLDLYDNQITDVSALSALTNLTDLDLGQNQIGDISALSALTNLTDLELGRNQISDVSVLSQLTNLTGLDLHHNQISDISALATLSNLSYLDLRSNPLNEAAFDIYLPRIQYDNPHIGLSYDTDQLFELTVSVIGNGTVEPEGGAYQRARVVTIEAWPEPGHGLSAWSGTDDDSSTKLTNTILMDSDRAVTVEFAPAIIVNEPTAGDVWLADSTHEVKWSGGYGADSVDILFSENAGGNWLTIEAGLADTGGYLWRLPARVDSNQCLISVVPSIPDSNVICIESGLFTIQHYPRRPDAPPGLARKGVSGQTGLSKNYGPELGCVKWQFETQGPVTASVTIGRDDRVYIPCEDGKLYTLDADGSLLWTYDTNSPLVSSPAAGYYGMVYVASEAGKLYAINEDGRVLWTHTIDAPVYSSPAVSPDGRIYICSLDGVLYALAADGSELWSFQTHSRSPVAGSIFASPAIAADGTIYIAGLYDPNLYALNPDDGSVKWACSFRPPAESCDPNSDTKAGWPFASPAVAADGTIYQTLLYDPNLYAIEPDAGSVIWSTNLADPCSGWFEEPYYYEYYDLTFVDYHLSGSGWSRPALGPDGTIYVSFDDSYLRAVDPDGGIKWASRLGMVGGFTLTVGSDGLIYAAGDDSHLYVVGPDGRQIAQFQADGWLSFPTITADDTIIVSDANNTLWAIKGRGCNGLPAALHRPQDLNADWDVDYLDLALLTADWLDSTDWQLSDYYGYYTDNTVYLTGDIDKDLYVDFDDFAELAERWLSKE